MDNAANGAASAGLVAGIFLFYALFILALIALQIWVYWRIFAKTGMNGALSLLNLLFGIGNLVCILILAFSEWPIERELRAYRAGAVPGTVPPPNPIGGVPMAPG